MGNPLLPGALGTPSPLDKSLSCSPGIHSRFHALRPPSGVKDTVAWGSPVCRWQEPAISVKSFHIGSNPPPAPSPPPSPPRPPRLQQGGCLQSADQGADLGRPSLLQGFRPWGLPRWLQGKESACQCRKGQFNPWVENILWRSKWQPTSVFFPGKSHGQKEPGGQQFMGSQRVGLD